jgi:hypothetical protein
MRTMKTSLLATAAIVAATSGPVWASTLIGTQVTGALHFQGYPQNYYDPVNGRVPAGYLNVAGTTVMISSNAVEFGYADGTATITADFTGAQLTVTDSPHSTASYNPIQLVFTDSAFTNLSAASDGFPNGGLAGSLSGGVITLNWEGGSLTNGASVQTVFNVNAPPLPLLSVQLTPANAVVISWPAPSTGFALQQNGSLNPASWVTVTNSTTIANGQNQVIVSPPVGKRFYRLKSS